MPEACSSSPHGSQSSHLRPLHPGVLRLPVLVWGSPGTGWGASRGLRRWRWLPGLQFLACPLLPLQERLHHSLQLHGPAGRAAPGTRSGRRGRPLWGGGPAALQCGGRGGAGAVQGGRGAGAGAAGLRLRAGGACQWQGGDASFSHQGRLVGGSFTCLQKSRGARSGGACPTPGVRPCPGRAWPPARAASCALLAPGHRRVCAARRLTE